MKGPYNSIFLNLAAALGLYGLCLLGLWKLVELILDL